jgi:hypothetical protein
VSNKEVEIHLAARKTELKSFENTITSIMLKLFLDCQLIGASKSIITYREEK